MSFILDALRKSESERQQDRGPSITRIPSAVPQQGLPKWALGTMAALGLGVVVLAGAWIKTVTAPQRGPVTAAPDREQVDAPETYTARAGRTPRDVPSFRSETSSPALDASRRVEPLALPPKATSFSGSVATESEAAADYGASPLAAAAQSGTASEGPTASSRAFNSGSPLADAAETAGTARALTGGEPSTSSGNASRQSLPAVEGVPQAYHSVAPSLGLPALTLELLAYGPTPGEQFVFIDGARYAAGDTLPGGARVIAINARGAVLLVQGRQLQLEPR